MLIVQLVANESAVQARKIHWQLVIKLRLIAFDKSAKTYPGMICVKKHIKICYSSLQMEIPVSATIHIGWKVIEGVKRLRTSSCKLGSYPGLGWNTFLYKLDEVTRGVNFRKRDCTLLLLQGGVCSILGLVYNSYFCRELSRNFVPMRYRRVYFSGKIKKCWTGFMPSSTKENFQKTVLCY